MRTRPGVSVLARGHGTSAVLDGITEWISVY